MTNLQYSPDLKTLIEQWMQQEMQGIQFPVDFDIAWKIAGYSRKDAAKRKLAKLAEGTDFRRSLEMVPRPQGGGKSAEKMERIDTCVCFLSRSN